MFTGTNTKIAIYFPLYKGLTTMPLKTLRNHGKRFDRAATYFGCVITCTYNGIAYAFPMLTTKFQDLGLSSSNVVVAGVLIQLGFGLISYPFAAFYTSGFMNLGPLAMDRLVNVASTIIVCIGLGMLTRASAQAEKNGEPISVALVCIGCLLWSSGLGISFYQSLTIANEIFADRAATRRQAVAFLSFSVGLGSLFFVVLFYYAINPLSLLDNFGVIWGIFAFCAFYRMIYMVRRRAPEPALKVVEPSLPDTEVGKRTFENNDIGSSTHDEDQADADPKLVKSKAEAKEADPRYSNVVDGEVGDDDTSDTDSGNTQRRVTFYEYFTSPIVWLLSVSAFLSYGVGAIFLNSLGTLAGYFEEDEDQIDKLTFQFTVTLLCAIILSRFSTTVIYTYVNWSHLNSMWNFILLTGLIIYIAYPVVAGAFIGTALVGLGFGGVLSCLAVLATTSFPGGVIDGSMNLAIGFSVSSLGPILLSLIAIAIYKHSPLNDEDVVEIKSPSTYIYFLSLVAFAFVCSVALGFILKRSTH